MYQNPIIIIHDCHAIAYFPSQQIVMGIRNISHNRHTINYLIPPTNKTINPCNHSQIVNYYLENEPKTPHHTITTDLKSWIEAYDENGTTELFTSLTIELARVLTTAITAFSKIQA